MNVIATEIPDLLLIEPKVFYDSRGEFFESFNQKSFNDVVGHDVVFVQDNHSRSVKNVLRGLHFQLAPKAQGKLVRVVRGRVFDVAVDLRADSKMFGHWVGCELAAENYQQLWIPPGFAHGFLALSDEVDFVYKTTEYYSPEHERCIRWDDPRLSIAWPLSGEPLVSDKDQKGVLLNNILEIIGSASV